MIQINLMKNKLNWDLFKNVSLVMQKYFRTKILVTISQMGGIKIKTCVLYFLTIFSYTLK